MLFSPGTKRFRLFTWPSFRLLLLCCVGVQASAAALPVLKPGTLWFGNVALGQAKILQVTLTNTSVTDATVSKISNNNTRFTVNATPSFMLAAGKSKTFDVSFKPEAAGQVSGKVAFVTPAGVLYLYLHGTGMAESLAASHLRVGFGAVQLGSRRVLFETLTNTSSAAVTVSKATVAGTGFSFSGFSPPVTLPAGHSYTFSIAFAPKSGVSTSGFLSVNSNAAHPILSIPLSGNGLAAGDLTLASPTLNFGTVTVGSSKSLTSTLSASGASVTISSATSTSSEFTLTGIKFPVTIAAGQKTSFTVKFAPKLSGAASGHISFQCNAANSPTNDAVSGTGGATLRHKVTLSWRASTSHVIGYNVYRSLKSGGPYTKLNPVLDASTSYVDASVQAGKTYYYVTTSVNRAGKNSRYSSQVRVTIPSQ